MLIRKLIVGILSFYALEVKRASFKEAPTSYISVSVEWNYEEKKRKEKKKKRQYENRKWKKKESFVTPSLKIRGTNPKDVRFSNQRSVRRMFRNS